jgi:peroxiredoxin
MKENKLSIVAAVLGGAGAIVWGLFGPEWGGILLLIGHGILLSEIVRVSGQLQYSLNAVLVVALALAVEQFRFETLGAEGYAFPFLGLAVVLGGIYPTFRSWFFAFFTHTRFLWLDSLMLPVSLSLYLVGNLLAPVGWPGWVLPALPVLYHVGFGSFQLYESFLLRKFAGRGYAVELNKEVPDFALPNHKGETVRLSDYRGRHHVLLLFVRGDWCPHCHMMLRTYQRENARFREKNIHIIAIGPDPKGVNLDMVQKLGLEFQMLSDDSLKVTTQYGIRMQQYIHPTKPDYDDDNPVPLPASFLVDAQGVLRYSSRPDRVGEFLNPMTIFPVVEKLAPVSVA